MTSNSYKHTQKFTRVVLVFFITGILISFSLWNSDRTFPTFPVFPFLDDIRFLDIYLHYAILGISLVGIVFPKRKIIIVLIFLILFSILFDQTRIQPWVDFYLLFFLGLCLSEDPKEQKKFLQIIFIGLYLWSGFHKINPLFKEVIFESILIDGFKIQSIEIIHFAKQFYLIVPFLEIISGMFLLFPKTRQKGVAIGLIGHFFILFYLCFGLKGNWVVVPWNIFLMLSLFILFYKSTETIKIPKKASSKIILIISFLLLPSGYLLGIVDHSLSFGLYDGKLKSVYIMKDKSESKYQIHHDLIEEGSIVDMSKWSFHELQVPFYPEKRFLNRLLKSKTETVLLITDIPLWKRVLVSTYKTQNEKNNLIKVKQIAPIQFKDSVFVGNYEIFKE